MHVLVLKCPRISAREREEWTRRRFMSYWFLFLSGFVCSGMNIADRSLGRKCHRTHLGQWRNYTLRIRLFIYITQKNPVLVATARFSSEVIFSNETCLICAMYFMDFSYRLVDTQPSDPQKSLKSGLLLAVLVLDPAYLKYVLCIKHNRTRRYISRKHFPVLSCLYRRNLDWESFTFP